jgi:hypothetical protein
MEFVCAPPQPLMLMDARAGRASTWPRTAARPSSTPSPRCSFVWSARRRCSACSFSGIDVFQLDTNKAPPSQCRQPRIYLRELFLQRWQFGQLLMLLWRQRSAGVALRLQLVRLPQLRPAKRSATVSNISGGARVRRARRGASRRECRCPRALLTDYRGCSSLLGRGACCESASRSNDGGMTGRTT